MNAQNDFSIVQLDTAIHDVLRELLAPVAELEILRRQECLTETEVEKLYSIPAATLRTKRSRGGGPAFRQGASKGAVYYTHTDIRAWLDSLKKRA